MPSHGPNEDPEIIAPLNFGCKMAGFFAFQKLKVEMEIFRRLPTSTANLNTLKKKSLKIGGHNSAT